MNTGDDLQALLNSFNALDRENQIEAIRLLRKLNIQSAPPPDEKFHIDLDGMEGEVEPPK